MRPEAHVRRAVCGIALTALSVALPSPAPAATFTVNSTADAVDANPGNGVCATAGGACTLRAAIQEANAIAGTDTINLPAGTYTLTIPGANEDLAATADLDITQNLTISGAGAATTVIDGGALERVFHILPGPTVTITGVTIRNGPNPAGTASLLGGGISNSGILTLTNVAVADNLAPISQPGAAATNGGGIFNAGTLTLTGVTLSGNTANSDFAIRNDATMTMTNSTVSGNSGAGLGSISTEGSATFLNVTIADNTAVAGGGLRNRGTAVLKNTILANNSGGNCDGAVTSQGHNLDSGSTCGLAGPGDLVNADPALGPLANNGGPTRTRALLSGSPAIDAGDNAGCPATDQRGVARPRDGDGNNTAVCDIGAFEAPQPSFVFVVTSTADVVDAVPGNGVCATATGACTLRAAIQEANALTLTEGPVTVRLPAGTYTLGIAGANEENAAAGDLDVRQSLTVLGGGAATTIVDGAGLDRLFELHTGAVEFADVTIRNGTAGGGVGGGILVQSGAALTLRNAILAANQAGQGGGLSANITSVTILRSTIRDNTAQGSGGGLDVLGTLTLTNSTLNGNTAAFDGGGILYAGNPTFGEQATLENVTLSGNTAGRFGGGILNAMGARMTVAHATLTGNTASGTPAMPGAFPGGGLFNDVTSASEARFRSTIVAANTGGDCGSAAPGVTVTSLGHNLEGGTACTFTATGDLQNADPRLGPLAPNGGPTRTHALRAGSPALDAGDPAGCPVTDQRGVRRPLDGTGDGSSVCDIGALESKGVLALATGPGPGGGPHVRGFTGTGTPTATSFFAYAPSFTGGVWVALGSLDGGAPVVVTGPGPGGGPHVRAVRADNTDTGVSFFAYAPAFAGGVRVATGDVDGDGAPEILTAPGPGGGPHVRLWRVAGATVTELAGFFAYDPAFTGGVFVAAGDVDGDGQAEVITGADAGGGAHVRVWQITGATVTELAGFLAYAPSFTGGVRVAAGDVDGDGLAEILTAPGAGGGPHVRIWRLTGGAVSEVGGGFFAYPASFTGGVFVGGGDVTADGQAAIVTGAGAGGGPHVRVVTAAFAELASFFAYAASFPGGVTVAAREQP